jgi:molybdopterin/thiamine biosynthesis adenylyltransferase
MVHLTGDISTAGELLKNLALAGVKEIALVSKDKQTVSHELCSKSFLLRPTDINTEVLVTRDKVA